MIDSVLKSMNTAVAITAILILCLYLPAMAQGLKQRPISRAWFLMAGILLTWLGLLFAYGSLSVMYWIQGIEVVYSQIPVAMRIAYLLFALVGGAIHIAAAQREQMGIVSTFAVWIGCMVAFVGVITLAGG